MIIVVIVVTGIVAGWRKTQEAAGEDAEGAVVCARFTHRGSRGQTRREVRQALGSAVISDEGAAAHACAGETAETDRSSMRNNLNPPLCPRHEAPCVVRAVKTRGPNFRRRYFACPRSIFPRARQARP